VVNSFLLFGLRLFLRSIVILTLFVTVASAQEPIVVRAPKVQYEFKGVKLVRTPEEHRPKIGLVLSGGGARGIAQIGVLRVLEQHNIPIDLIVGNSLGSVIGGLYASGYSSAQIESIIVKTNWDEVLPFSENTKRTELFIGQKQAEQSGYLLIRFDGLQPIIPSSLSGGQRLSNYLMSVTLQAPYHPDPSFDDLKIPFRAVATDLLTGRRVVLDQGSLSEAMRSSVTVPLLYSPVDKDLMQLVDGGLTSNIPVDVAKSLGCNIVIVVNSTSGMRQGDQLNEPWEIADQIMTIMMQEPNELQLKQADIVITPEAGSRLVSDFDSIGALVHAGEIAAQQFAASLKELLKKKTQSNSTYTDGTLGETIIEFQGDVLHFSPKQTIFEEAQNRTLSLRKVEGYVEEIGRSGKFRDVYAEVFPHTSPSKVVIHLKDNPTLNDIHFRGNFFIENEPIEEAISSCKGKPIHYQHIQECLEKVLLLYRGKYFSLARIENVVIDTAAGLLSFRIYEGVLEDVRFQGNKETKDYVIRRELELEGGEVFRLDKVSLGLINVASTGLFEYALVEIRYEFGKPIMYIKVKEKSTDLLVLGLHADNEHGLVSTVKIRDANFRGAGEDLSLTTKYGHRDRIVQGEYRLNRIFNTYLTSNLQAYFRSRDVIAYRDAPTGSDVSWRREEESRYREIKYGGTVTFGNQLERLGEFTTAYRLERHRISRLSGRGSTPEDYQFASLRFQSTIDSENKFYFPTEGLLLTLSFEYASRKIGSDVSFNKILMRYESYTTLGKRHTIVPRFILGFADETLPTAEKFSLGGLESFFGLREDDSRGRQIFLVNFKYRYWLPFKLVFESYVKFRYDLGMISEVPQELKLSRFRHGVGVELSLETPLGPATFAAGKSFYLLQDLPDNPLSFGPLLLYFTIGPTF
jgi:NTE family protein